VESKIYCNIHYIELEVIWHMHWVCVVPLSLFIVISLFLEIGYVLLLQDCTQVNCKEERPICVMYCLLVLVIVCFLVK
jgi:hypothetical protein